MAGQRLHMVGENTELTENTKLIAGKQVPLAGMTMIV